MSTARQISKSRISSLSLGKVQRLSGRNAFTAKTKGRISENEWREFVDHLARDRKKKRENPCPTLAPIEWFVGVYA